MMPKMIALLLGTAVAMPLAAQPRMVSVGDAEIRYESVGTGDALVLIHGWAQDLGIWDAEVAAFAPHWRVVRYDRRGFGHSTGHADPTANPADLRALLDSLGITSATVVGLSAGAGTALRFAAAFPDRVDRLVLYGYVGAGIQGLPALPEPPPSRDFGRIAREFGMDSLKRVIFNSHLVWTPPGQEGPWTARLEAWWNSYDGRDLLDPRPPSGRVPPPSWDRLASLNVPTLLLTGAHDVPFALAVNDALAAHLPNARRVIIPAAGHGAHFHQPERFHQALREFLAVPARTGRAGEGMETSSRGGRDGSRVIVAPSTSQIDPQEYKRKTVGA